MSSACLFNESVFTCQIVNRVWCKRLFTLLTKLNGSWLSTTDLYAGEHQAFFSYLVCLYDLEYLHCELSLILDKLEAPKYNVYT